MEKNVLHLFLTLVKPATQQIKLLKKSTMKLFQTYIQALKKFEISEVTEHTYRKELQELLEGIAKECKADVSIQHEPKRTKGFGAPDFKVKTKGEAILGYVENKKLEDDLTKTIKSDQLKKYQSMSNNIILTNYIDLGATPKQYH